MLINATSLTAADLTVGSHYLWLQVTRNGLMMVGGFTMLEVPVSDGTFVVDYYYECGRYLRPVSYEEVGCPTSQVSLENYNRVFAADDAVYDRLCVIATQQNLVGWLSYLEIPNPEAVAESLVEKSSTPAPVPMKKQPCVVSGKSYDRPVFEVDYADVLPREEMQKDHSVDDVAAKVSHRISQRHVM